MPVPKGFHWGGRFHGVDQGLVSPGRKDQGVPEFWGRYIARFKITPDEITFLRQHSPQTKLLLIFNPLGLGFFRDTPADPEKEHLRGKKAALAAQAAANALDLHIPSGVGIYVNMEKDSEPPKLQGGAISSDWILGWWEGMRNSKFGFGGIYGNVSEKNKNVGFIGDAYTAALQRAPGKFAPLWSAFPHNKPPAGPAEIKFDYGPGEPSGSPGSAQIWQYFATIKLGTVDMNLATKKAFDAMWKVGSAAQPKHERGSLEEPELGSQAQGPQDAEYQPRHGGF
jgi:hypothetical protein